MSYLLGSGGADRPPANVDGASLSRQELPGLLMDSLRLVWSAGPREFVVTGVLQVASALGMAAQLFASKSVFAAVLGAHGGNFAQALPALAVFGAVTVGIDLARSVENEQGRVLGELVAKRMLERVIDVALSVELIAFEEADFHDRLQRAQNQSSLRAMQTVTGILSLASGAIASVGIIAAIAGLQPLLVPLIVGGFVPLWLSSSRNSRDYYRFSFEMTPNDRRRLYLQQLMLHRDSAKEVRALQLGSYLRASHERLYEQRLAMLRTVARRRAFRSVAAALSSTGVLALGVTGLGWLYSSGRMSLAVAGASLFGLYQLSGRLQLMHFGSAALYESTLFVRDYAAFVRTDTAPSHRSRRRPAAALELLAAESISFTYPNCATPAVDDVSVRVGSGEIVALVGENGSGKTTLAKLLAALYRPQRGHIYWNGRDAADIDPDDLRHHVAVIFQDFERYLLTVRENIGFGRHENMDDIERVTAAAQRAGAMHFIRRLPARLETSLGKQWADGQDLSLGQWQRLAIARAFFRDASLVILDEPAAALDARAEAELFTRMRELLAGRAAVLISHRFSSVRSADRIYVLEGGCIVEHGSHDDLLAQSGTYAELFTLQAAQYVDLA